MRIHASPCGERKRGRGGESEEARWNVQFFTCRKWETGPEKVSSLKPWDTIIAYAIRSLQPYALTGWFRTFFVTGNSF